MAALDAQGEATGDGARGDAVARGRGRSPRRSGGPAKLVLWAGSFEAAGTQRFLLEFLRRMDRSLFEPTVFSTLATGELLPEIEALGVAVHEFGTGRHVLSPQTVHDLSRAASFLRRERVEVLSCMLGLTTLFGPLVGRAAGVPVVVNNQRNLTHWFHGGAREKVYGYVCRRVVDAVVVNSSAAGDELVSRFGVPRSKVQNVGVGTRLERFNGSAPDEGLRHELGLDGAKVVGIVGKLSPVKGHRHFLESAALVSRARDDVRFLVVGDGPEREKLERRAGELGVADSVRFAGVRENVPEVMGLMDVLVLSSLSEGSPNVVLEGMAAGLPIVATRVGGVPELVRDGETGLLVEPGDAAGMAEAALALLDDPGRADAMGKAGRATALDEYDIARVVERFEGALYDLLVEAGRRPAVDVAGGEA